MLNRWILLGLLVIIALVLVIVIVVKSRNTDEEETTIAVVQNNAVSSSQNNTPPEVTTTEPVSEEKTEEPTTESIKPSEDGLRIVCIDPGHGGDDPGAGGQDGIYEKDDTLKMSKALKTALKSRGVTVYMTREDDSWVDKEDRVAKAAEVKADLLISVHRNEYKADSSVSGFETWVHNSKPKASTDVAERIQKALVGAGISRDRGVKFGSQTTADENYYINSHSSTNSCLMEMGFMTNATDNNVFRNNTDELAEAMADAIVDWMDAQGL